MMWSYNIWPWSFKVNFLCVLYVGIGGLGITCSPRDPRFAGSNPAEDVKILSTSPPGGI